MLVEQWRIRTHIGKTVVLIDKIIALPICTPQILHISNRVQTLPLGKLAGT